MKRYTILGGVVGIFLFVSLYSMEKCENDESRIIGKMLAHFSTTEYLLFDCEMKDCDFNLNLSSYGILELSFPAASSDMARRLKKLDLSLNSIEELSESIGNMYALEELNLSFNNLKKLPRSLEQLKNLKKLFLKYNKLGDDEKKWVINSLPEAKIYIR